MCQSVYIDDDMGAKVGSRPAAAAAVDELLESAFRAQHAAETALLLQLPPARNAHPLIH